MGGRGRVVLRFDSVGAVACHAGRQVPGCVPTAAGVNAGRHLCCLAAMTRRADDAGISSALPDPMSAMTGDARGARTAAVQPGMDALGNLLMRCAMACAATDRLRLFGVRSLRDVGVTPGACQR